MQGVERVARGGGQARAGRWGRGLLIDTYPSLHLRLTPATRIQKPFPPWRQEPRGNMNIFCQANYLPSQLECEHQAARQHGGAKHKSPLNYLWISISWHQPAPKLELDDAVVCFPENVNKMCIWCGAGLYHWPPVRCPCLGYLPHLIWFRFRDRARCSAQVSHQHPAKLSEVYFVQKCKRCLTMWV